jgi:hypothetical protein
MKLILPVMLSIGCILSAALTPAFAQEPVAFSPMNIDFMSGPIAFDNDVVTGAPYSAEAITEVVQTLGDGNRIVRESKTQIARDGKGRTRREQGLAMFGPLISPVPASDEPRHVHISDPTSKTTIMLDPQHRTAHRIPAPQLKIAALNRAAVQGKSDDMDHFELALPAPPPGMESGIAGRSVHIYGGRKIVLESGSGTATQGAAQPAVENLGQQFMEGVTVEGTRTTMTIPAGGIGNELPITIVSEQWFSPELKVLVMSRQSDPRFGEKTYRLTNISRDEPAPELFEVPADYQVFDPSSNLGNKINREVIIQKGPR